MKPFEIHVVLCVLVWRAHASDFKPSVGTHMRRTSKHGELQSRASKDPVAQDAGRPSTASRNTALLQASQATDSAGLPVRRSQKGRRPVPEKKPSSVPDSPRQGPPVASFRIPNGTGSINILAGFAGRNRVLVISAPRDSNGYYRLMMSLLRPDVYCEMADRHMQQIVMFHEKGAMGGKIRRINNQGSVLEEPLDPSLVPRMMSFLKLEEGKFGMVLLRKTLQVEERYPYPVRLEAVYEAIDQTPMRRLEKARQKGFVEKCSAAGVEGQLVQNVDKLTQNNEKEKQEGRKPSPKPTQTTTEQTTVTTIKPTTISTTTITFIATTTPLTTTTTTTTLPTTISTTLPSTTTNIPTTSEPTRPQTSSRRHTTTVSTMESTLRPATPHRHKGHANAGPNPTMTSRSVTEDRDKNKNTGVAPTQVRRRRPVKGKLPKGKSEEREKTIEHTKEAVMPTIVESQENQMISKEGKATPDKAEKKKKTEKPEKSVKTNSANKKATKASKATEANLRNRSPAKKTGSAEEKDASSKPPEKPADPKRSLETFLSYFEKRRRLLVITAPNEQNGMYSQQKDEYLEQVCDMALRKISIITIFGPLDNSTMKIDHYQMEQDKPVRGLPDSELINQELITAFRKELGMVYNDFYMVLTDFDLKVKQEYEVPIIMKAVFDYIDTFSSRLKEMELQRKLGIACKKEDKFRSLENFLSRFRWRRRLLVISTPDPEEWGYQQQLYAMTSQVCNLGLRHMSVLKLVGKNVEDMAGVLELYPINGFSAEFDAIRTQVKNAHVDALIRSIDLKKGSVTMEREDLSASLVRDVRNYFQVSPEYFSMLLVGKDGNVKSWYPSPMWSMSIIYDLIDSMQLRRQEMAIQLSLGMRCPDDEHDGYHDGYHRGYGY